MNPLDTRAASLADAPDSIPQSLRQHLSICLHLYLSSLPIYPFTLTLSTYLISICRFHYLSIYICLATNLSNSLCIYIFSHLTIYQQKLYVFIYPYLSANQATTYLFLSLSVYLCGVLPIYLSMCLSLSIFLCIHRSMHSYLSINLSTPLFLTIAPCLLLYFKLPI